MPRSYLMAKTKKFDYNNNITICIECYRPAKKVCSVCGMPLCKLHSQLDCICESCREDDNENGLSPSKRYKDLYE